MPENGNVTMSRPKWKIIPKFSHSHPSRSKPIILSGNFTCHMDHSLAVLETIRSVDSFGKMEICVFGRALVKPAFFATNNKHDTDTSHGSTITL